MNNDDLLQQIRKIVREEVKAETEPLNKRLDTIEQDQSHMSTAIEALAEGQREIRETMATKQELAGVEERLRNDIEVSRADAKSDSLRILGKLDKQNSRIENLEKRPEPRTHTRISLVL